MTQMSIDRKPYRVEAIPTIAAIAVAAVALLVLIGWAEDITRLKSVLQGRYVAMNPATAMAFLLSAGGLWLVRRDRKIALPRRVLGSLCAVGVLLIAACRLGEYLRWWLFRLDTILFSSSLHGNAMAPNTAEAFALFAIGLLILDVRPFGRVHPAQPFLLATAAIGGLSLVGYSYHVVSLYGVHGAIPMAFNTAILFFILAAGTLCGRPDREPLATVLGATSGGVVARRLMPAAFIVPLVFGGMALYGLKRDFYEPPFAMTLFVVAIILAFDALIWWIASVIHRIDLGRQRTANELQLSEERYHAIMRQTTEGVYLVDLDSNLILETNIAMAKLLGYCESELEGQPVATIIDDSPDHIAARLRQLKETRQSLQGERRYRRKDGSTVEVFAGAAIISYAGRSAACTVLYDVTERNRAHKLLQEKHDQLEKAVAAERAAMEKLRLAQSRLVQSEKLASLGQMVAGVAHEINNPLSFVSNNVAVLQRDVKALSDLLALYIQGDELLLQHKPELVGDIHDLAERMDLPHVQTNLQGLLSRSREGLRRIQQIVKDLRDFARLDESDLHEVDLNAGIESTVNIVAGRAKKKRVELNLDLKPLPLVSCYPAKINQVVMNLVANAIDACPEGGKVTVQSMKESEGVQVVVTDNGPGVPPGIRDRIFDPFFTTKPQGEGTGLGLSISYGIINDHGGNIEVTDGPQGGAVFTIWLPLKCAASASA